MTPLRITLCMIIALAMLAVWSYFNGAFGAGFCDLRENMVKVLAKWNETCINSGYVVTKTGQPATLEIYTSKRGTFSVVITDNDGVSCLMAIGKDWSNVGDTLEASR